jgi:DNA-binding PadR family transcriptional regulator
MHRHHLNPDDPRHARGCHDHLARLSRFAERFADHDPGLGDGDDTAWAELHLGGRGPRFPGGHGFRHFGFGGGGPGGFGFRSGRKLSSGDLQLLLLALLGERPRHGYDLIKAVEERSKGFYSPSPGVIYPALTYLEEAGEAVPEAEGTRKLYRLTDAGRAHLEERRAEAATLLERLEEMGRGMDRLRDAFEADGDDEGEPHRGARGAMPELHEARHLLHAALREKRGATREELVRVAAILRRAAEEILGAPGGER